MTTRLELNDLNFKAWNGENVLSLPNKLDSSLKKNSAFVRKIKTHLSSDLAPSVIKDIELLTLSKYLTEIIESLYEGLCKVNKASDLEACNQIISKLHQRFVHDFTPNLLIHVLTGLSNDLNTDEVSVKVLRQRNLLRVVFEMSIIGVFRTIKDVDKLQLPEEIVPKHTGEHARSDLVLVSILKDLLYHDLSTCEILPHVSKMAKRYFPMMETCIPEQLVRVKAVFTAYSKRNLLTVVNLNEKLNKLVQNINKSTLKYGQLFEEKSQQLNELQEKYEVYYTNTKILCEELEIEFPELEVVELKFGEGYLNQMIVVDDQDSSGATIWQSPEEQRFYTVLPDLKNSKFKPKAYKPLEVDGDLVNEFLITLDLVKTDEELEKMVITFQVSGIDNKATRNRMLKFFTSHEESSNFRFFAKFLKMTQEQLGDLTQELVDFLETKMRGQLFRQGLNPRFIYFYVEMIKFKLIPSFKVFHKLKTLTTAVGFSNNLSILTMIYDTCGRFLLNDSDYRQEALNMIELLKKEKKLPSLGILEKSAITNLLLNLEAPRASLSKEPETRKYTVEQEFLIRLLKHDLSKSSVKKVLELVSKFPLHEPEYSTLIIDLFTNIEFINYQTTEYLIEVLRGLTKKIQNKPLYIKVIDQLVEDVIRGVELNDYRLNKQRMAHMKLLSEIYNKGLITINFVVDICFKMIGEGHPNHQPLPLNYEATLDAPNNFFKIRLICMLFNNLDFITFPVTKLTVNVLKVEARNKLVQEKLGPFMAFFQYYVFCKKPLPLEIQFEVDKLHQKMECIEYAKVGNLQEAVTVLKSIMLAKQKKAASQQESQEIEAELEEGMGLGDDEIEQESSSDESSSDSSSEDEEEYAETQREQVKPMGLAENEEQDDIITTEDDTYMSTALKDDNSDTEVDDVEEINEYEEELTKQFQSLMTEAYRESTPINRQLEIGKAALPKGANGSQFRLLLKKGDQANVRQIEFNDEVTKNRILQRKQQRRLANERIMNLVNNMED